MSGLTLANQIEWSVKDAEKYGFHNIVVNNILAHEIISTLLQENKNSGLLKIFADRVEKLAFEMKAPNAYTPQFVMMAQEMRTVALRGEISAA